MAFVGFPLASDYRRADWLLWLLAFRGISWRESHQKPQKAINKPFAGFLMWQAPSRTFRRANNTIQSLVSPSLAPVMGKHSLRHRFHRLAVLLTNPTSLLSVGKLGYLPPTDKDGLEIHT